MDDKKKGGNDGNGEKDALEKARELSKTKCRIRQWLISITIREI